MQNIAAHFDGRTFVPDEPVPAGLAPNTKVTILLSLAPPAIAPQEPGVFDAILRLAVNDESLPPDFSEQHDHYIKGTPKR